MELDIDKYIKQTENMQNCSNGGSAAYNFGDVVLVKYVGKKGEPARRGSEKVAEEINKLNAKGVRIPKHLAIKRMEISNDSICWVLQETAKGNNMAKYQKANNQTKLFSQRVLLNAPNSHFEHLVKDVYAIAGSSVLSPEYQKSKNLFYDPDKNNGGFTLIDFLCREHVPDVKYRTVYNYCSIIANNTFYIGPDDANGEQQAKDNKLAMDKRIFDACEAALPNFADQRRDVLRSISHETVKYFARNGVIIGDLTLDDKEQEKFATGTNQMLDNLVKEVEAGKLKYQKVQSEIDYCCDKVSWRFHPLNPIKRNDYDSEYNYNSASDRKIRQILLEQFNCKLDAVVKNDLNANQNLVKAWQDMQEDNPKGIKPTSENNILLSSILRLKNKKR